MYNDPYDPLRRRFQPPPADIPAPGFPQAPPVMAQPAAPGPQMPMQWQPMGDDGTQAAGMAGAGLASLLQRFKKPSGIKGDKAIGGFEGKF